MTVGFSLGQSNALAEEIAGGLVVVGRGAYTEEVAFKVGAHCAPVGFPLGNESDSGLPA